MIFRSGLCFLFVALAACAPTRLVPPSEAETCRFVWRAIDATVSEAGTGDAEAAPIAGHPQLRTSRFLASFSGEIDSEAWIDRLAALGQEAVRIEIANLPPADRARLEAVGGRILEAISRCDAILRPSVLGDVAVDDHYSDAQRVLGLYPLAAVPVAIGYDRWRAEHLPLRNDAPPLGELVRYHPDTGTGALDPDEVGRLLKAARDNALAIPEPAPEIARRRTAAYAPVWLVDTVGPDDRPGTIVWGDEGPAVDTTEPTVYHRFSWTRWRGEILLQINYLIWFPGRTAEGALDLLAGRFDGVIWRVTLGPDGRPLMYDTIHACGCYHLFLPVPPLVIRETMPDRDLRERPEIAAPGPALEREQRLELRLAAGSHYLQGISVTRSVSTTASYPLRPMSDLRSLEKPDGSRRSFYSPDGLVAGSERLERLLLWPMGVASAGAMRQWGTHATAFIGRRHFDDPWLIENAFRDPRHDPRHDRGL